MPDLQISPEREKTASADQEVTTAAAAATPLSVPDFVEDDDDDERHLDDPLPGDAAADTAESEHG